VVLEVEDPRGLLDLLVDLGLVDLGELEREAHVVPHGHVRIQGVVLEHHRDVAILRSEVVDDLVADEHLALGDVLEPGDHPQGGRLPTTGRADEDHELAVADQEIDGLDGLGPVGIPLGHALELNLGHCFAPSSSSQACGE
jgi:hypothetical protein